jgi:ABC-2 type transport system ATP-binding protein
MSTEIAGGANGGGQFAAVDEELTGRENIEMIGLLYRLPNAEARVRAKELLGA